MICVRSPVVAKKKEMHESMWDALLKYVLITSEMGAERYRQAKNAGIIVLFMHIFCSPSVLAIEVFLN